MKQGILVLLFGFCIGALIGVGWYWWKRQGGPSTVNDPYVLQVGCVAGANGFAWLTWPAPVAVAGTRLERSANGENFQAVNTALSGTYVRDPNIQQGDQYQYRIMLDGKPLSNVATITINNTYCKGDVRR